MKRQIQTALRNLRTRVHFFTVSIPTRSKMAKLQADLDYEMKRVGDLESELKTCHEEFEKKNEEYEDLLEEQREWEQSQKELEEKVEEIQENACNLLESIIIEAREAKDEIDRIRIEV